MKRTIYLFGAGKLCFNAIEDKVFDNYTICGIFDNYETEELSNVEYPVVSPRLIEGATVCVTSIHRSEMVKQLLDLGYREFLVLHNLEGKWRIKEYNYSCYDNFEEKHNKVLFMGRNLSGSNSYGIYQTAKIKGKKNVEFVYRSGTLGEDLFYQIITSKYILVEYDREIFPKGKVLIQMWHGFGPKGSGFRNKLLTDEKMTREMIDKWLKYDLVCSYSDTYSTILGSCYCIPSYKVRVTGMPRNDVLLSSKHSFAEIYDDCKGKKVILYMPTFRKKPTGGSSGDDKGYLYNFANFDYENLNSFCKERDIVFIIKHHIFDGEGKYEEDYSNIKFMIDEHLKIDFYEYMGNADLLITDYSSAFTDFLLLNKPILFLGEDLEKYAEERGFLFEPVEEWLPGPVVTNYENFLEETMKLLSDSNYYSEKRTQIKNISHRYQDDKSGERILECIYKMMDEIK